MFLRSIHHHFLGVPNLEYLYGDWPNTMLKTPLPLHGMEDHKPDITFFEHTCEQCSYDVILKILTSFTPLYPEDPHFCDDSALFFPSYPPVSSHMACWRIHPTYFPMTTPSMYGGFKPSTGRRHLRVHSHTWMEMTLDMEMWCEFSWIAKKHMGNTGIWHDL